MKTMPWIGAVLLLVILAGQGLGNQGACDGTSQTGFWHRFAPSGGWNPYGGGLLHWWTPACFPHGGGPDDYCRKPLPRTCWPCYLPYTNGNSPAPPPSPQLRPQDGPKMP